VLPIEKSGLPALPILVISAIAFALAIALPLIPWTAAFFGFQSPTLRDHVLILGLAAAYLVATELVKRPLMRFLGLV
jgi:Mg2+-importing ATPase